MVSDKYYVSKEKDMKRKFKGLIRVTKISAEHVDILRRWGYLIVLVQDVK